MHAKNAHGYAHGDACRCGTAGCKVILYPAQVRVERHNSVTHEVTFPLVTVDILMGLSCGTRYGQAF
jgi:hypothetical protein